MAQTYKRKWYSSFSKAPNFAGPLIPYSGPHPSKYLANSSYPQPESQQNPEIAKKLRCPKQSQTPRQPQKALEPLDVGPKYSQMEQPAVRMTCLGYHTPNFFTYLVHLSFTAESIQDTTSLPSSIKSGKQITHVASDAFHLQIRLLRTCKI